MAHSRLRFSLIAKGLTMKSTKRQQIQAHIVQGFLTLTLILIVNVNLYAQASHQLLLEKESGPEQFYLSSPTFPEKVISERLNKSFRIRHVNYRENSWFVLMEKDETAPQQQFYINPSEEFLKERLSDGYEITDMTFYPDTRNRGRDVISVNNAHDTLFVLTKVSNNLVRMFFWSESLNLGLSSEQKRLADTIDKGYKEGYLIKFVKSNVVKADKRFGLVMTRNPNGVEQIFEYRQVFTDLINNKSSQGYRLTSLSYHNFNNSWLVVLTKYPSTSAVEGWLLDYKRDKNKIEDYLTNKGFRISALF